MKFLGGPILLAADVSIGAVSGAGNGSIDSQWTIGYGPVAAGGWLYSVTSDDHLVADYQFGGRAWTTIVADKPSNSYRYRFAVGPGPTIFRVYSVGNKPTTWHVEARYGWNGKVIWDTVYGNQFYDFNFVSSPVFDSQGNVRVIFEESGAYGAEIVSFTASSGKVVGDVNPGPVAGYDFSLASNNLMVVALKDEYPIWKIGATTDANLLWANPISANNNLGNDPTAGTSVAGDMVITCDGHMHVWSLNDGSSPLNSIVQQTCAGKPIIAGGRIIFVDPVSKTVKAWGL